MGRTHEAAALHRDILVRRRRVFGPDHNQTLRTAYDMVGQLQKLGLLGEAKELPEDTWERRRRALPSEPLRELAAARGLATIYRPAS